MQLAGQLDRQLSKENAKLRDSFQTKLPREIFLNSYSSDFRRPRRPSGPFIPVLFFLLRTDIMSSSCPKFFDANTVVHILPMGTSLPRTRVEILYESASKNGMRMRHRLPSPLPTSLFSVCFTCIDFPPRTRRGRRVHAEKFRSSCLCQSSSTLKHAADSHCARGDAGFVASCASSLVVVSQPRGSFNFMHAFLVLLSSF
jgi:hypothetical protein